MSANLRLYEIRSAAYHLLEESIRNTVGTPLVSIAKAGDGRQRAGFWTLTFTDVVPSVSAKVVVASDDPHDPSRNASGVTIALDGTTIHTQVIKGLGIVFSSSASFTGAWTARAYYGGYYNTGDATEQSVTRAGTVEAGSDSTEKRIACRNDGADLSATSTVRAVNGVYFEEVAGTPLVSIDYTEVPATANFAPGYLLTFANKNTAPTPDVIDVLIDGLTYDVKRIDTGVAFPGGAGVPIDSATVLEWTAGPLTGVRFVLFASTANSDQARVFVSDGARLVKIAPDLSGSPGVYQAASTPLQLTEDGGLVNGEVGPSNTAFFWTKVSTQVSDSPVGNERHWRFVTRGLSV